MTSPDGPAGPEDPDRATTPPDSDAPDPESAPPADAAEAAEAAEPEAEETAFEGPRRRARREREQRREAQQRARALADAQLEAKRRARGGTGTDGKPAARGTVGGLKMLVLSVLLALGLLGLGLVLYFTPLMSVRNVVVVGTAAVTNEEVLEAAQVVVGTPLLQIDTGGVANRVAAIRPVASARVQREYPSALRITVTERIPVAVKDFPEGSRLYDADGVDFTIPAPPPNLPYLDVESPGPADPATRAALDVLTSLRPEVAGQVGRVGATSVASVTLTLTDGRVVVWGTNERTEEKAEKLAALLTQPGHTYDVSSPDLPTVK